MIAALLPVPPGENHPMPDSLPALSLVAVPGPGASPSRSRREAERRGFSGLYVPSIFGNMAQSTARAERLATERVIFGTAIAPIYARTVEDFAHSAAYIHEVSAGGSALASASPMPRAICAWG